MKKSVLKYLWLILWVPLCVGCNNEDDIDAIFTRKKWKIVYLATTTNWEDPNNYTIQFAYDKYKDDPNAFTVYFGENTIVIRGLTAEWSGTWSIDGKSRAVHIQILQKNHDGKTSMEQEFMTRVSNARYYKGDENILKLFVQEKTDFAQFTPSN